MHSTQVIPVIQYWADIEFSDRKYEILLPVPPCAQYILYAEQVDASFMIGYVTKVSGEGASIFIQSYDYQGDAIPGTSQVCSFESAIDAVLFISAELEKNEFKPKKGT